MKRQVLLIMLAGVLGFGSAACAATKNPLALSGKHSNDAPIEINADSLEVFQEENKAIFVGHVVAIQGDVRLKSDKMIVYYRSQEGGETKQAAPQENAIRKIDVEGNVFLATPEETASGATGIYDVEHQEIRLNDKVVLTRGKNTLKGDRLVYDFKTGKSTIVGGAAAPKAGTAKERVRALFVPDKDKEKK